MPISEVQRVEVTGAASSTTIAGTVDAFTVGRFVRVLVRCDDDPTSINVTDDVGNTYNSQGGVLEAGTTQWLQHFVCEVDTAGASTITAAYGTAQTGRGLCILEYTGVIALDGSDEVTDTGSNPTPNLSITNTTTPGVMFCAGNDVQGGTLGNGTGFTDDGVIWSGFSATRLQRKDITSVAAQTGNFSNPSLNRNNAVGVIFSTLAGPENVGSRPSQMRTMPMIRGPR